MSHDPHDPHDPHGPAPGPSHDSEHSPEDRIGRLLSTAQFLVTGTVLIVIASLAYVAGMHSAKGGGHGQGGETRTGGAAAANVDVALLLKPTPELVAEGKAVFSVNCASCHGTGGKGDGPAATALNPKPRNFTEGYWRYGGGVARIVRTVSEGSPGTAMAAFASIPLADRFALAHFIRSLAPKLEEDKPEDLAWLGPVGGEKPATGEAPGGGPGTTPAPSGPVISIEEAMAALEEPEPAPGHAVAAAADSDRGSEIYRARCASCHGASGEGGVRVRMLGSSPYAYVVTRSLGAPRRAWTANPAVFERLVLQGIPGYVMPANGDLSRGELRDLYLYTQKLRAGQETAGHAGS